MMLGNCSTDAFVPARVRPAAALVRIKSRRLIRLVMGSLKMEFNNLFKRYNPNGVVYRALTQPFQGCSRFDPGSQGSREARQPWAKVHNRFAVLLKFELDLNFLRLSFETTNASRDSLLSG